MVAQRKKPKRKMISGVKKEKLAETLILSDLKLEFGLKEECVEVTKESRLVCSFTAIKGD